MPVPEDTQPGNQLDAGNLPPGAPPATAPIAAAAPVEDDGLLEMADPLANSNGEQANATAEQAAAAATQVAQQQPSAVVPPRDPSTNVVQEFETFLPLAKPWDDDDVFLPLAADTIERTREILDAQPNINVTGTDQGKEWAYNFNQGQRSQARADYFQRTVSREGSDFRQVIKSEQGPLGASGPKLAENTQGVKATGEPAVLRVRALMGLGTIVQIPLWHSGFWVTLKAPTDSAFLELHRRLTDEKITLGRQTYGLAFANQSVVFAGAIVDFVLQHVLDTSLKEKSIENIRAQLSSLDIPLLAWGLACTVWPKGFQYARSIPDQTKGTTRVIKERLNLSKLLFTDTKCLTPWQITHMGQRHGNLMTNDSVAKYRNEFTIGRGREVELVPGLKVALKVPSLDDYLSNGQRWVNGIVAMVDKAFGMSSDGEVRDDYILAQGRATNFRQYGHWVERIDAQGTVVDNPETMEEIFNTLSSSDEIRTKFFEAVRQYMEDSTFSIVAVPTFEESEQKLALPRHPHLLPLDVLSTFFTLLVQRVNRVISREE